MFKINKQKIDQVALEEQLTDGAAGALATFSGWVRNHNEGQSVLTLEYEAYESLAEKEAIKILAEAKARFAIIEAVCEHRVGVLAIGDMAVFVGVTAAHRGAAFDACRFIIDEIKLRLPIWKKETYSTGETGWVNCSHHEAHRHEKPVISEREFYSKQNQLAEFKNGKQSALAAARVLVVGAGGLGCPALQHLAGAGVGQITVCDDDLVSVANLHRQNLFTVNDVGQKKSEIACRRLALINPFIKLTPVSERLTASNAEEIMVNHDVVLDCSDNLKTKFLIADKCRKLSIALLQASIYQYEGQLLLTQNGGKLDGQCFRCLWSEEANLEQDETDCVQNCAEAGVVGAVAGVMGSLQAFECIAHLLGMQSALRTHMMLFDLLTLQTKQLKVRKNPDCPLCSEGALNQHPHPQLKPVSERLSEDVSPFETTEEEIARRSERDVLVAVDVREEQEKNPDSAKLFDLLCKKCDLTPINMPLSLIELNTIEVDSSKEYLFICQSGTRSLNIVRALKKRGFNNVSSLKGGLQALAKKAGLKV